MSGPEPLVHYREDAITPRRHLILPLVRHMNAMRLESPDPFSTSSSSEGRVMLKDWACWFEGALCAMECHPSSERGVTRIGLA